MVVVAKEIIAKNYYNNYKNNIFFQWSAHSRAVQVQDGLDRTPFCAALTVL